MGVLTEEKFEEHMESFAKMVKEGFDATATKVDFVKLDERVVKIENGLTTIKGDITTIKATMVTKDYLDEKLADLRGDLVVLMRKEDTKLKKLIEKLRTRNVLDDRDVQDIVRMEPFAVLQP